MNQPLIAVVSAFAMEDASAPTVDATSTDFRRVQMNTGKVKWLMRSTWRVRNGQG